MQQTLGKSVSFSGVGLHSGAPVRLVLRPAPAGHGIWLRRTDVSGAAAMIPASWDAVERGPLNTKLVNEAGVFVGTVEHVMAALAGAGVHNALIEIDGPEMPIMDGSAAPFLRGIVAAGLRRLDAPVRAIEILRPVQVEVGSARAALLPEKTPTDGFGKRLVMEFHIDFPDEAIGQQSRVLDLRNGAFSRELSDSRTFCRASDIDTMHAQGLALGGTMENSVVVDGPKVLTPGGLRHRDEPVRHKMLDALGDLSLAGGPILGRYVGWRAGHAVTNTLLRQLFATPGAYRIVDCDPMTAAAQPGAGLTRAELPHDTRQAA
ncbi:UDP-3-O-acyl-N-acetylglucosamine deacetylase [Chachezhania sediminis]|uniref:UDP-3-O-acyl-N-acetylglucosamine deacetylase n=1 Tax=Chachezhania sediminis TaxID=2599291 RepID=UPI00131ECDE4|nr:UDP-3-O-acyl-N-acetylglucosamine deacetylase [Chachezhania sediminis]